MCRERVSPHTRHQPLGHGLASAFPSEPQCHGCSALCVQQPALSISWISDQTRESVERELQYSWKLWPAAPPGTSAGARLTQHQLQVMNRELPYRWICSSRLGAKEQPGISYA